MPTLVLPPRQNDDCRAMAAAAIAAGWQTWAAPGWRIPAGFALEDPVPYSDPLFADVAAAHFGLALLEPPLDFLPRLPERFRGRAVELTTLKEARRRPGPLFAKPADEKSFPAQVYASGAELPGDERVPAATPVLFSEPVRWIVEYRCFVSEGKVVALSPYLREGELARAPDGSWPSPPGEAEAAARFADAVLADPGQALAPAFVLDVGSIDAVDGPQVWAVVEANPAWGSGIYGCDPAAALGSVRRAVAPRSGLASAEAAFARAAVEIEG